MEQYGNTTTFNIEKVLYQNAIDSLYFKNNCVKLSTFEELVDEIYYSVDNVEPWMSGNARGATSAFCLLMRLGQLEPTDEQVQQLLDHTDSPYIRALGFLYLRYVLNPRSVWDWLQYYIKDHEEFKPSGESGKSVTIGAYARDIFLDQYYFETIFPRIPKPVADDLSAKLAEAGLPGKAVGNAGQGGGDRRGLEEAGRRPASVKASLSVAFGQRAPNRAGGREEGRGLGSSLRPGASVASIAAPRREYEPSREATTNGRESSRGDYCPRDSDRERERPSSRDRERLHRDDRDRERSRHNDRHPSSRGGSNDRERAGSRDRRDYDRRDRERGGGRRENDGRDRAHGGSRGRSGQRSRSRDRDTRDVFKDRARGGDREAARDRY